MSLESARALVIRGSDWSESSRIVTLWTREFGKVRGLAKGGRRLKSSFENALDLLNVCDIVLVRKTSGSLDTLTESRVQERFPHLRRVLPAWYAGQYVAELLGDLTQDHDPHPALFDEALETLRDLGTAGDRVGPRVARFELVLLRELGYGPALEHCAACNAEVTGPASFSAAKGGLVCVRCQAEARDRLPLPAGLRRTLLELPADASAWRRLADEAERSAMRRLLSDYVTYVLGRRPRLMAYVGS
jgi:DNA repair protein RecO (recombination protein O)